MADKHNSIDDLFRKAMEGAEMQAPEGVWQSVSAGLGTGGGLATTWFTALKIAAVAATGGGMLWLGSNLFTEETQEKHPIVQTAETLPQSEETSPADKDATENAAYSEGSVQSNASAASAGMKPSGKKLGETPRSPENPAPGDTDNPESPHNPQAAPRKPQPEPERKPALVADPCKELPLPEFQYAEGSPAVVTLTAPAGYTHCRWVMEDGKTAQGNEVKFTLVNRNRLRVNLTCQSPGGCSQIIEQTVNIQGSDLEGNLLIPNVFTPNADGFNDPYKVLIVGAETFRLTVFDKEGKLLFTSTDTEEGWDGKVNGIPCAAGMYVARVNWKFYGHEEENKTVAIWLKR
jgi:gliding motility-associated-like protein